MIKLPTLLLGAFLLAGTTPTAVQASPATAPTEIAGLPETVKALPPAFKATWRKKILHRPNYTYYKGDKKRKGFFKFLSFGNR